MTDLRIPVLLEVDLGPAFQDELAAAGLMAPRSNQGGHATGADDPADFLPAGEAPLPPSEDELRELAGTLAAAERLTPRPQSARDAAPPDPTPEPFFVGLYARRVPVFGCPGCAFRARASVDVMWHLEAYPHHAGGET